MPTPAPSRTLAHPHAARIHGFEETVFAVYARLARETEAVDLGQGFPDFDPPDFVRRALAAAADGYQQYAPLPGWPELREEVAFDQGRWLGRDLDPLEHVQITVGATEGLFAAMQALLDPGDEVVLFEPFYDAYPADVTMAGGRPVPVPLRPVGAGRWSFDPSELARAVSDRTRLIVVNTPHNPTGTIFDADELDRIVALAARHDALILSDEVYEHIAFRPHVRLASRPGAFERSLTLSSFGKSFSVTGWKLGWAVGAAPLIDALRLAHQWIPFAVATPLQRAGAAALRAARADDDRYYRELARAFEARRDRLLAALAPTPFEASPPDGGYFVMADHSALGYPDDVALCRDLPRRAGVGAIPPSAFYSAGHREMARNWVRFAFCKGNAAIDAAGARLREAFGG